jgi:hypothetical protein
MEFNKQIILVAFLTSVLYYAHGQGATTTTLEQIAALKTYANAAAKGYQATEKGLATIKQIRQGEFDLHTTFFHSLQVVNPAIRNLTQKPAASLVMQDGNLQMTDGERLKWVLKNGL